ncbi:PGA55, partial [Candida africana]
MLLNTAIHYWIFLLSIVSSSWIKYPIEISSIPGWHKEPTDIKEAQNVCDKDSEINNDLYCYPQCFNKEDDQPKLDHCCFNENGRVLYVSPCTVEPENEATTTEVAADQTETLPAADSTSAATSTVTADLEKYPQCFNKEDDQPKREHCCFDDNDRVLYPKPCYATSEDLVTTTDDATIETTSLVTTDLTSTTTTSTVDDVKKYPQCFNKKNDKPKRKHCCFDNDGKVLYPKPCSVTSKGLTTKTGDDTIIPTSLITTDSSSTIDDVKKYPQCFNKKNDKPKRKHCCFDNNDRVLYPKPCTKTSERTASTTAENTTESESSSATTLPDSTTESESVSSTFTSDSSTESESISSTTTSDASDSTETHDINRYPRCFFKYSNQPNRSRCCFNSQYQVLYPWPCDGSSQSTTTTVLISISGTKSSSVTTTFDENLGTSSELTISSSSDLISTSQDIPQATTINNSTTSIESSANGSTLPLTQPILSVSEFESSVSDATNSNSNSNPTFTAEGGHSSDEMLTTTDKNNSLTSKSVATPTETSWLNSVAGTSSKEDMRTSTGTISSFSEVATTEMISSPSETGNPKKSSAIDYGTNSDITTLTGRYTSLRDKTVSTLQEDAGIESTTVEGITKTVHTTVYVTTSPDNSITTETAVVVVVTNDSTATTYTEIIQTTVVEGKTLTTAIPIPQDEINKIKVIEYSTILPTTLPNGQVTSVIEKVAVAVNGQGQKVTKTAPIELGAYTTKGFEIIQDSNDIGNSVAEGYNPSAGLGGSTLVAPIAVVSNENSASLPKVNLLLVKFLLLVLLIV